MLTYGYVLARAAAGRERMSILDWGGGLGHYHLFTRALLPEVEVEYHCKEMPRVVAAGRDAISDVSFHDDDRCLDRTYELVLASGSLQYAQDWAGLLRRLGAASRQFLYVARLPVSLTAPSFVALQRAGRHGYETEYLGWVLARDTFIEEARRAGLALEREFLSDLGWKARGAPSSDAPDLGDF